MKSEYVSSRHVCRQMVIGCNDKHMSSWVSPTSFEAVPSSRETKIAGLCEHPGTTFCSGCEQLGPPLSPRDAICIGVQIKSYLSSQPILCDAFKIRAFYQFNGMSTLRTVLGENNCRAGVCHYAFATSLKHLRNHCVMQRKLQNYKQACPIYSSYCLSI